MKIHGSMYLDNEEEEYQLSLSRFESMLKTNKVFFFDSEEFEDIVLHYLDTGKLSLAKKALHLGLEQHPHATGLKLVQVEVHIFLNKLEAADRILNELERLEPKNEEIHILRANIYSKKGQHEEAIKCLQTALKYTEDYADIYSLLGMEYLFTDQIEKAKDSFVLCLKYDQDDHSSLYNVVYCYDFLNQHEEAITYLDQLIDQNPYCEIAWHQLGRQYYTLKDYEKAVWAFDYANLIDEEFIGAYLEKGKALEKLNKFKEAIDNYLLTLELDEPSSYVLLRIGNCHEQLENFNVASKFYKEAVHEDPLLDKGWITLADLYIKQEKFEEAIWYVQKALQIDDTNERYWIRYAMLNKSLLRFAEAEIGYQHAASLVPFHLETWLGWSDVLMILQKYDLAIEKLLQASEFTTDNALIAYRLAAIYFLTHDYTKGAYHLTIALNANFEERTIIRDYFPIVWENPIVQNLISKHPH